MEANASNRANHGVAPSLSRRRALGNWARCHPEVPSGFAKASPRQVAHARVGMFFFCHPERSRRTSHVPIAVGWAGYPRGGCSAHGTQGMTPSILAIPYVGAIAHASVGMCFFFSVRARLRWRFVRYAPYQLYDSVLISVTDGVFGRRSPRHTRVTSRQIQSLGHDIRGSYLLRTVATAFHEPVAKYFLCSLCNRSNTYRLQ